jgi:dTDP-4-amino-4,6-dideoxy-D-galactose acyltransferase
MIEELIKFRKDKLYYYSQYSFLPKQDRELIVKNTITPYLLDDNVEQINFVVSGFNHVFLVKKLEWDSQYFSIPTMKLLNVLFAHNDYSVLKSAFSKFKEYILQKKNKYFICEIPSEDNLVIQALNEIGFKLVETRLTYYLDLNNFSWDRYKVRSATTNDIDNLKRVAREMRNEYDRFHSDKIYTNEIADEFLATYIEASVKGFADFTIVPDEFNVSPDAFVTAKYLKNEWELIGENISIMVLSAVSAKTCKGWYIKLISEMAYHLKEIGVSYAFMHPATTNRTVIHTYERLGCKYGKCINVLTLSL